MFNYLILGNLSHGMLQNFIHVGLSRVGDTHQHHPETYLEGLKQFQHFLHLGVFHLQLERMDTLGQLLHQGRIAGVFDLNAREQVLNQRVEERQVFLDEFRNVGVPHGPNQNDIFFQVWGGALDVTRHHQHRLDATHTEIVMLLLRQLLGRKLVQLRHFLGKWLGRLEAFREKHDFGN